MCRIISGPNSVQFADVCQDAWCFFGCLAESQWLKCDLADCPPHSRLIVTLLRVASNET